MKLEFGELHIHLHHHGDGTIGKSLSDILQLVQRTLAEVHKMSKELDDLKAAVAANTEVTQSVATLVDGLAAKIVELKDDPAALEELAAEMNANSSLLGQKVVENTPAAPPTGAKRSP